MMRWGYLCDPKVLAPQRRKRRKTRETENGTVDARGKVIAPAEGGRLLLLRRLRRRRAR